MKNYYFCYVLHPALPCLWKTTIYFMFSTPYYPTYEKLPFQLSFAPRITLLIKNYHFCYVLYPELPHLWKTTICVMFCTLHITTPGLLQVLHPGLLPVTKKKDSTGPGLFVSSHFFSSPLIAKQNGFHWNSIFLSSIFFSFQSFSFTCFDYLYSSALIQVVVFYLFWVFKFS